MAATILDSSMSERLLASVMCSMTCVALFILSCVAFMIAASPFSCGWSSTSEPSDSMATDAADAVDVFALALAFLFRVDARLRCQNLHER